MTVESSPSTAARVLPSGVVTFLFSDIEGSTKLLHRLGDEYADVLRTHHRLMRECFLAHDGVEVDTEGDAFFVAFASPRNSVAAAVDAQRALHDHAWPHGESLKVRMGVHTGDPLLVDGKYVGIDVHRAARICSSAHGGQVVLSARVLELVGDRLPPGVRARDLGLHRLKDLAEPEHLLQLDVEGLPTTFPALRSLEPPTNVPAHAAALIGRERERTDLREMLLGPGVRLVTVTGPGGAGKTRLSGAMGLELRDQFPFGVYFVDLTNVRRETDVLPAIAEVLQLPHELDQDVLELLSTHIGDHRMLLILDNFEQVVDGALEVSRLLQACADLHVLATSRVPLGLDGEWEYMLPPLGLPHGSSLEEVQTSDAVQLFVERARKVRRDFQLTATNAAAVAEVCLLLDGLPLAIELAAARTKLFGPESLLARLGDRLQLLTGGARDLPERHRTLRSTIDWSYELLDEEERRCFLDLSVFEGGARLGSIEAVLGTAYDVLDPVSALVNHSLVMHREDPDGQPRFTLLQTMRDYAHEMLSQDPERLARLREAHADHFLEVVETSRESKTPADKVLVERDYANIRAALAFWSESATPDTTTSIKALRLATNMSQHWYQHGLSAEGAAWLDRALARAQDPPDDLKAQALRMLGVMSEVGRHYERARDLLTEALELYRRLGDRIGEARSLNSLGVVARSTGDLDDSERLMHQALAVRREIGETAGVSVSLNNLGIVRLDRGAPEEAAELFSEALRLDREMGDDWGIATCSLNLGVTRLLGGDHTEARRLLREALRLFVDVDDADGVLETMEGTVGLMTALGELTVAARLGGASEASRRTLHLPGSPADRAHLERWLAQVREGLGEAAYEAAWREGGAMTHQQALVYLREALGNAETAAFG